MQLDLLSEKFKNCSCGKTHTCPIDSINIGAGAMNTLPQVCGGYHKILLVSDRNTDAICAKDVREILGGKIANRIVLQPNGEVVIPNEEMILKIEEKLDSQTDFILGIGSGVINDLCKHVSFLHQLDYGIVATAPSMDGYASTGAALILKGMKITLNARPPKVIIGDTNILKNAPLEMIQAGYGDIVGKYSCLNDWKLSTLINGEYFCDEIYKLTLSQAETVKEFAEKLLLRDDEAIAALMEALVIVGVAMSYVGNSRPASGSEHHLSHFFEITGILENKQYYAHGIDVLYSSAVTAKIREQIVNSTPQKYPFHRDEWASEIERIYSTSSGEVIALQDKLGWYGADNEGVILEKWERIQSVLKESPSFAEFVDIIARIGLSYDEFLEFYGLSKINDGILYAKDLKDRYSVLWLNYQYFKGGLAQ